MQIYSVRCCEQVKLYTAIIQRQKTRSYVTIKTASNSLKTFAIRAESKWILDVNIFTLSNCQASQQNRSKCLIILLKLSACSKIYCDVIDVTLPKESSINVEESRKHPFQRHSHPLPFFVFGHHVISSGRRKVPFGAG